MICGNACLFSEKVKDTQFLEITNDRLPKADKVMMKRELPQENPIKINQFQPLYRSRQTPHPALSSRRGLLTSLFVVDRYKRL